LRKFKEQIEGFPACLYQSCDSYIQAHQYLEQYLQENNGNETIETTAIALAGPKINNIVLGYEDLTKKKQDDARTLPKGIYIQNIMSKMRLLQSATTTSPAMQADGVSDIDIDSPPAIHQERKSVIQKHTQKNKMSPQQIFIAGKKFYLSKLKKTVMTSTTHQKKLILVYKIQTFVNLGS
jgi:hypothetical protein